MLLLAAVHQSFLTTCSRHSGPTCPLCQCSGLGRHACMVTLTESCSPHARQDSVWGHLF
ncbi:hypothetical protein LIA77_00473 [Sarocladium implicatum]|nr:hypothetical protein LIA77_00473 [Sarocladium implicatum]